MESRFRQRLLADDMLTGMFIKTGAHEVAELLGAAGLDFAIVDAEHAPLGLDRIDRIVLGSQAADLPCLVRLPALAPSLAGQMLDMAAAGIVVPRVASAAAVRDAVGECRYRGGRRGFSPSTRAGGYGFGDAASHVARADARTTLWCQIECVDGLRAIDAIAAVDGVDVLFIGRADLAQSMGVAPDDDVIAAAVRAITAAGRQHGRKIGIYVADMAEARLLRPLGITVFACGSDQSHLAAAARRIVQARSELAGTPSGT